MQARLTTLMRTPILVLFTLMTLVPVPALAQIPSSDPTATETLSFLPASSEQPTSMAAGRTEPLLIDHQLTVMLDPHNHFIDIADFLIFPEALSGQQIEFRLNQNLEITASSPTVEEIPADSISGISSSTVAAVAQSRHYRVTLPADDQPLYLSYQGQINDQSRNLGGEYARSFAATSGIIDKTGVFLSAASVWIPVLDDEFVSFKMDVRFSESIQGWTAVSQGERLNNMSTPDTWSWRESQPMEEIYLVAADFTVYSDQTGDTAIEAYLRTPDPNLATRYMDATARYLQLYETLFGDYPFAKFALVENFQETGYGMPSFTLLGQQVIRLPFILESSYPHEILHNWWGNGVYPDYSTGNWSEGITTYLADHLFREMEGLGHEYRKQMLIRYRNYVAEDTDFPLSQFTARNSAATQSVGYGKTLMLWHMLRLELGDEMFLQGLRQLYAEYRFRRTSWENIEQLFSEISERDLSGFFRQWVQRTGAPELSVEVDGVNGNRARLLFAQTQFAGPYSLKVPVALYYEGESEPQLFDINLSQKTEGFFATDYDRLQGVQVDPYFDVFRTLDREETPPSVGELFGASDINFILPETDRERWLELASNFGNAIDADFLMAEDLDRLPVDRPAWILGRDNPWAQTVVEAAEIYGVRMTDKGLKIAGEEIEFVERSTLILGRHPENPEIAIGWLQIDNMEALPGIIEKLPHYGRYSYLSFTGVEPTIEFRGEWESNNTPLQWVKPNLEGSVAWDSLPIPPAIAELPPKYLPTQLARHTKVLTAPEMQGRGLGSEGLVQAADYIAEQFKAAGLQALDGSFLQHWTHRSENGIAEPVELTNVVGMISGSNPMLDSAPVVLGAHYDHLGVDPQSGQIFAGADDNASGVAVLIEVAGKLAQAFSPQRPILFVAFSGEEAGLLGSKYFVRNPPGIFETANLFAMINLDAVGRLEGKTLEVFASDSAYEWPFMAQGIGYTIGVPSKFPAETIASGDHVSFLNAGIPAIHVFSGAHLDYHQPSDTADKLDLEGMSDVALWTEEALLFLGDRIDPLRVNLTNAQQQIQISGQTTARKASLGTVPDFAYNGEGIRIAAVAPSGAAAEAGLLANDVLLSYNGEAIDDLQAYSNLIRASAPEQLVTLDILRNGQRFSVQVTLEAR